MCPPKRFMSAQQEKHLLTFWPRWNRRQGWINSAQLEKLALPLAKNGYGQYLINLLKQKVF